MILYTTKQDVVYWATPGEHLLLSERYWARKRGEPWPMRLYRQDQTCVGELDDENRLIIHEGVQAQN